MNSEIPDHPDDDADRFALIKRAVVATLGSLALIFLAGIAVGFTAAVIEHDGPDVIDVAVLGTITLLFIAGAWGLWRYLAKATLVPEAPRVKRSRRIIYVICGISAVLGILLGIGTNTDDGLEFFSNAPVDPVIAVIALAVWLVAVPVATWVWWKSIDEHEAGAYRDSGLIAAHLYMFLVPTWWLASRAGFLPPQDPMIVFILVSCVWSAVWFGRRYF